MITLWSQEEYLAWNRDDCRRREGYIKEAQKRLPSMQDKPTLLDMGCGYGAITAVAQSLGFSATGIDACPARITQAQVWFPECTFETGTLDQTFPTGHQARYDIVVMFSVLACTGDATTAVQGALGLLKPGGCLIIDDKNAANEMLQHVPAYHAFHWSSEENFYFTAETLVAVCQKAGAQVDTTDVQGVQRYGLSNLLQWIDYGRPQIKSPQMTSEHPMLVALETTYRSSRELQLTSDHLLLKISC